MNNILVYLVPTIICLMLVAAFIHAVREEDSIINVMLTCAAAVMCGIGVGCVLMMFDLAMRWGQ